MGDESIAAAEELFAALEERAREPERYRRAVVGVRGLLERAVLRRREFIGAAGVEVEDVVQELSRKLLRDPPRERGRAEAVIVGWAKVVARNHLLDLAAKRRREVGGEAAPEGVVAVDEERAFDAREAMRRLERCAEELGDRQRAAYQLLREDAEMSRIEMARRLEIVSAEEASEELLRKAQANAWAIVSRVRARLAECLERHGMLELLPDTVAKLRSRSAQ